VSVHGGGYKVTFKVQTLGLRTGSEIMGLGFRAGRVEV
jgi:hypothetical protein